MALALYRAADTRWAEGHTVVHPQSAAEVQVVVWSWVILYSAPPEQMVLEGAWGAWFLKLISLGNFRPLGMAPRARGAKEVLGEVLDPSTRAVQGEAFVGLGVGLLER